MKQNGRFGLISLGSNAISPWGDRTETIRKAMLVLQELTQTHSQTSQLYETPAFPVGSGPNFVNAVVAFYTQMSSTALLTQLHAIEAQAGRTRTKRWGPRTLDLDLIALGDEVSPDLPTYQRWVDLPLQDQMSQTPDQLILPHPRMHERAFVLVPLADVAPSWIHPVLGRSALEMRDACETVDLKSVVPHY